MLDVELKILLTAVNAEYVGIERSIYEEQFREFNFQKLFQLAHHHGFIWQVLTYCQFHQILSESQQLNAKRAAMIETAHSMASEQQLLSVIKEFTKNAIPYAVIKGAAIHSQFTPSKKMKSRYSADIDILVKPESIREAVTVLKEMSYTCVDTDSLPKVAQFISKYSKWLMSRDIGFSNVKENKVDIDLHWKVAHWFSLPLKTHELLSNSQTVQLEGSDIQTLSFNDHFILLCIHGYLDKFFMLKHLADIFWAMKHPYFDREKVNQYADELGVGQQVFESCETATFFFENLTPKESLEDQLPYVRSVYSRFQHYQSEPPRMHPGETQWSFRDKLNYIKYQIKTRSKNIPWWSPILLRFKFDMAMVESFPAKLPVYVWWPFAIILKVLKR